MSDFDYGGYKIYESTAGFEPSSGLCVIQSYIATKDTTAYGFAFCISTINAAIHGFNPDDPALVEKARQTVTNRLDAQGSLVNREEYTFEYDSDTEIFEEVENATWWVKTSGGNNE